MTKQPSSLPNALRSAVKYKPSDSSPAAQAGKDADVLRPSLFAPTEIDLTKLWV